MLVERHDLAPVQIHTVNLMRNALMFVKDTLLVEIISVARKIHPLLAFLYL